MWLVTWNPYPGNFYVTGYTPFNKDQEAHFKRRGLLFKHERNAIRRARLLNILIMLVLNDVDGVTTGKATK